MIARLRRRRPERPETGASAVEFALIAPVLFFLVFGIIDYGIWFADSISARQAVRDGARRGVVEIFGSCQPPPTGPDADLHNLACTVKAGMAPISGTTYVRISVATAPGGSSGAPWSPNDTLRVCAMTQHTALMPLVPFPSDGISRTKVEMPIEQATITGTRPAFQEAPPSGSDWSWCP